MSSSCLQLDLGHLPVGESDREAGLSSSLTHLSSEACSGNTGGTQTKPGRTFCGEWCRGTPPGLGQTELGSELEDHTLVPPLPTHFMSLSQLLPSPPGATSSAFVGHGEIKSF